MTQSAVKMTKYSKNILDIKVRYVIKNQYFSNYAFIENIQPAM